MLTKVSTWYRSGIRQDRYCRIRVFFSVINNGINLRANSEYCDWILNGCCCRAEIPQTQWLNMFNYFFQTQHKTQRTRRHSRNLSGTLDVRPDRVSASLSTASGAINKGWPKHSRAPGSISFFPSQLIQVNIWKFIVQLNWLPLEYHRSFFQPTGWIFLTHAWPKPQILAELFNEILGIDLWLKKAGCNYYFIYSTVLYTVPGRGASRCADRRKT